MRRALHLLQPLCCLLLSSSLLAQPQNDNCGNAINLPSALTCCNAKGTVSNATSSGIAAGACAGNPNDDVWYKFTAASPNPSIALNTISSGFNAAGPRLQLFSGPCGALTAIGCASGTAPVNASGLTLGAVYYLRVYSSGGSNVSNGSFQICVTDPPPCAVADSTAALFNIDTIATQLGFPWEVAYGPDDSLWITEARGYRVLRMSASRNGADRNRAPQQVLKIPLASSLVNFNRDAARWPQGGMQGLAIHPLFMSDATKRWVYLSYVYKLESCPTGSNAGFPNGFPCVFRSKIVRCRFYFAGDAGNPTAFPHRDTLTILDTLISNLPGSNDHNSGRLVISPEPESDGTYKLYYSIGDMGAGQFNNDRRTNYAQVKDTLEGKILRLNTQPDGDLMPGTIANDVQRWCQWIPNDNPFHHSVFTGFATAVFSYGHRNAQGLVWGNARGWKLYSSEHGDRSDDEINIIRAGRNYGWPFIAGYNDDNYTTADNAGDGFLANDVLAGMTVADEHSFAAAHADFEAPVLSLFGWHAAQLETASTNIFTWPTIAPSGIDFYEGPQPGWQQSLLVTSLKYGLFRLRLNADGDGIDESATPNAIDTLPLLHGWRVRDLAISANGSRIFVVIDSTGATSGPTGGFNGASTPTKDGGKVLRLSFKSLVALPLDVIRLDAALQGDAVALRWRAALAAGTRHFVVERSADGKHFMMLGMVESGAAMVMTDAHPVEGDNYYRVGRVDREGKILYSSIVHVDHHANAIVTAYPNPASRVLHIRVRVKAPVAVEVRDGVGRLMYGKRMASNDPAGIDVSNWPSQLYVLSVKSMEGETIAVGKFLKQ